MSTATVAVVTKPSLWKRIEAELKLLVTEIEHDEPEAEKVALGVIALVVPIATTVLTVADPAAAPLVAPIASRVQAGLAALTVAVEDAGLQPTIPSVASAITAQLAQFEQVAGIKDTKTLTNIATINAELDNIVDAFTPPQPTMAIQAGIGGFFKDIGHDLAKTGEVVGEGAVVGAAALASAQPEPVVLETPEGPMVVDNPEFLDEPVRIVEHPVVERTVIIDRGHPGGFHR